MLLQLGSDKDVYVDYKYLTPNFWKAGSFSLRVHVPGKMISLWSVHIAEGLRGKGYGQKMLQEVIEYVRGLGYTELRLLCKIDNCRAFHIYTKLGFKVEGLRDEKLEMKLAL